MLLFARYEALALSDEVEGVQLRFGLWESDLVNSFYAVEPETPTLMDVVVGGERHALRLTVTGNGLRVAIVYIGGKSIRELGDAVGLQTGDYAKFTLQDEGTWLMELGQPPGFFLHLPGWSVGGKSLPTEKIRDYFKTFSHEWAGTHDAISPASLLHDYAAARAHGIRFPLLIVPALGDGPPKVEFMIDLRGVLSYDVARAAPNNSEHDNVKANLWLNSAGPSTAVNLPLYQFVTAIRGQNLALFYSANTPGQGPVRHLGDAASPTISPELLDQFQKAGTVYEPGTPETESLRRHYLRFRLLTKSLWPFGNNTVHHITSWQDDGYLRAYVATRYREIGLQHLPVCLSIKAEEGELEVGLDFDVTIGSSEFFSCFNKWLDSIDLSPYASTYLHLWTTAPDGEYWTVEEVKKDQKKVLKTVRKELADHPGTIARFGLSMTTDEVKAEVENLSTLIDDTLKSLVPLYRKIAAEQAKLAPFLDLLAPLPRNLEPNQLVEIAEQAADAGVATIAWPYRIPKERMGALRRQLPFRLYLTDFLPTGERCATHLAEVIDFNPQGTFKVRSLRSLDEPRKLTNWANHSSEKPIDPDALAQGFVFAQEVSTPAALPDKRNLLQVRDAFAKSASLFYPADDIRNLYHALHAVDRKHFVILHGVSGTGKSQFAQAYTNALYGFDLEAPGNPYFSMVPVQPTWQDRTALLGYYNPLTQTYVVTDFLRHMLAAYRDPDRDYVICLDEMNLAAVEHYFADFLSGWESKEAITLHTFPEYVRNVPTRLTIPQNLYVIGTVNVDETTHSFSPKVLDRAYTVEFSRIDVEKFAADVILKWPEAKDHKDWLKGTVIPLLKVLNKELAKHNLHFAYRTTAEICRFLLQNANCTEADDRLEALLALDLMLVQKVLPRLRGDDRHKELLGSVREKIAKTLGVALQADPTQQNFEPYQSLAVLTRLLEDAEHFGTYQFWR